MRCSDGYLYVVKFRNNPQGVRVLANEFIASRLARLIGLSVPPAAVVSVDESLIRRSPRLRLQLVNHTIPFEPGLHFGSQYPIGPVEGRVQDLLPMGFVGRVRNPEQLAGILAFDKWTGNYDDRQAVLCRRGQERKYTAFFVGYGYCFGAENWTFPDYALRGALPHNTVYSSITGWESFEPWLTRMEELDPNALWNIVGSVPPPWYNSGAFATVRFVGDWHTVLAFDSMADVEFRESIKEKVERAWADPAERQCVTSLMQDTLSNTLQISHPRVVAQEIEQEVQQIVESNLKSAA